MRCLFLFLVHRPHNFLPREFVSYLTGVLESRTRILWTTSTPRSRHRPSIQVFFSSTPLRASSGLTTTASAVVVSGDGMFIVRFVDEEDIRNDLYCSSGRIRLNEDVLYLNVKQDNLQHMLIYLTLHNQLRPVSSPGIQGNHPRC